MKKLMITTLMLLSVLQMVAQNANTKDSHEYLPLIEENKQWNVCYTLPYGYRWFTVAYKWFGEDTVINDLTHKIIYSSETNDPYQWRIDCFMREDTATQKVYQRYHNHPQNERIVYDFNINEGDTIYNGLYLVVESVNDIILGDGITRKKIELSNVYGTIMETWIEGIGSSRGLTNSLTWDLDGYSNIYLMCMTVNDEILYRHNNAPQNCWRSGYLGIDDIDKEDFLIYPNPAREYTYIDFGGTMSGEMEIYGIAGMLVAKREYNGEALRLDLTDLQPGVYFVRLGNATMKFVKM